MGSEKCFVNDRRKPIAILLRCLPWHPVAYESFCSYITASHPFEGIVARLWAVRHNEVAGDARPFRHWGLTLANERPGTPT